MEIRAVGYYVVLEKVTEPASELLPEELRKHEPHRGTVISIGMDAALKSPVQYGNVAVFAKYADKAELGKFFIVHMDDILAVVT